MTETVDAQPEQPAWRRIVIEKPEPHGPRSVEQLKEVWLEDPAWNLDETAGFEGYREHLRGFAAGARAAWAHPQRASTEPGDEHAYAPTHEVLVNIAQLMTEQLATMQHIRASLDHLAAPQPQERSVSSVEIKFLAPTKDNPQGKPQPVVKVYEGSEAPVERAIMDYARAVLMAQQGCTEGWEQTLDVLQAERAEGV